MAGIKVVRLAESEIVRFAPDSFYQPLLGDDAGTIPVRTGIQTCLPGYVAAMHSHPYIEIIHILEGTAEAWSKARRTASYASKPATPSQIGRAHV